MSVSVLYPEEHANAHAVLAEQGAVLLRGFGVNEPRDVAAAARSLGITPMVERERFAARESFEDKVYSSSEWPPDETMCMHHEASYAAVVPSILLFACLDAPHTGGATALADSEEVLNRLPAEIVADFETRGWQLVRTYREMGVPWTESFGVTGTDGVADYCRSAGIEHEWLPDGALRTRQRRRAVHTDLRTGRRVWFNQAAFLNEFTLDPIIREYLVEVYGPDALPFNTTYGDGTPIPADVVETINATYAAVARREPWQVGDLLLVDNLRVAHSRDPYEGDRTVLVVLGDPVHLP